MKDRDIIQATARWVQTLVVGLNLCPFAQREVDAERVRYRVSSATTEEDLLTDLQAELERLQADPSVETTLLIHPEVLQDFSGYNQFLGFCEVFLREMCWEGIFQVASFHPDYQFEGTRPQDAENYSNRSPYPMLHLIRETSLEKAIASYPDVELVPQRNIELMNKLGAKQLQALLSACFTEASDDSPQSESPPHR